jgi:ankyrin repeat protein
VRSRAAPRQTGWTALHQAAAAGRAGVIALLLDRGAAIEAPSTVRAQLHGAQLRAAHRRGAQDDGTPLCLAAQREQDDAVSVLLDRGAAVTAQNAAGWTPLHHAAFRSTRAIAEMLLDRGADLKAQDKVCRRCIRPSVL